MRCDNEKTTVTRLSVCNGCSANNELSHLAAWARPRWRIPGTLGALVARGDALIGEHK
jgi:hypothetical protein